MMNGKKRAVIYKKNMDLQVLQVLLVELLTVITCMTFMAKTSRLIPHTSHLTPHPSRLKPHALLLKPHVHPQILTEFLSIFNILLIVLQQIFYLKRYGIIFGVMNFVIKFCIYSNVKKIKKSNIV